MSLDWLAAAERKLDEEAAAVAEHILKGGPQDFVAYVRKQERHKTLLEAKRIIREAIKHLDTETEE